MIMTNTYVLSSFSSRIIILHLFQLKNDDGKELLNHPVVRLMIKNKTNAFRIEYWLRFFLQLTLLFFLTLHSLIIPPPYYVKKHLPEGNYTWLADGEAKWKEDLDPIALVLFGSIGTWLILLLTVIYFFEMVRIHVSLICLDA